LFIIFLINIDIMLFNKKKGNEKMKKTNIKIVQGSKKYVRKATFKWTWNKNLDWTYYNEWSKNSEWGKLVGKKVAFKLTLHLENLERMDNVYRKQNERADEEQSFCLERKNMILVKMDDKCPFWEDRWHFPIHYT